MPLSVSVIGKTSPVLNQPDIQSDFLHDIYVTTYLIFSQTYQLHLGFELFQVFQHVASKAWEISIQIMVSISDMTEYEL